jgi:hypothetical protein
MQQLQTRTAAASTLGQRRRRVAKAQQLAPLAIGGGSGPSHFSAPQEMSAVRSRRAGRGDATTPAQHRSLTTPPLGARRTAATVAPPALTGFYQHPSASPVPKAASSIHVPHAGGPSPPLAAAAGAPKASGTAETSRAAAVEELARAFADEVSLREGKAAAGGGAANAESAGAFGLDSPPISPVSPARGTSGTDKAQTLIILDWDDTLLPSRVATKFMAPRTPARAPKVPASLAADLDLLSEDVIAMLKTCKARGRVIIVTNAMKGWVETSGKRLLPKVLAYLTQERIPIVSAQNEWYAPRRRTYNGTDDPAEWKAACFENQVNAVAGTPLCPLNLLSIGDSMYERTAAQGLLSNRNVGLCKTVKFVDTPKPTIAQLRGQITSLIAGFETIAGAGHSFDVDMEL